MINYKYKTPALIDYVISNNLEKSLYHEYSST